MSRYWSKSLCSKGGWVTFSANFRGKGASPPTNFGIRKLESLGYRIWRRKNAENFNLLSKVHTNVTDDKQTDGSAIAYSELELKVHVR